jgi:hypothetical protein
VRPWTRLAADGTSPAPAENIAWAPRPRGGNGLSDLTQPEDDGRGEIQPGADQRRQSEYDSDANRKANIAKPVLAPGWTVYPGKYFRGVGDCFALADVAVLGSVAAWNYNGLPVRATLHGDYSDAKLVCRNNEKERHLFRDKAGAATARWRGLLLGIVLVVSTWPQEPNYSDQNPDQPTGHKHVSRCLGITHFFAFSPSWTRRRIVPVFAGLSSCLRLARNTRSARTISINDSSARSRRCIRSAGQRWLFEPLILPSV